MNADLPPTRSCCPKCRRVLPAAVVERDGEVFIEVACPEHGASRTLYKKDAAFYRQASRIAAPHYPATEHLSPRFLVDPAHAKIVGVDVTDQCNLRCPVCFASANESSAPPMTTPEILDGLKKLPSKKLEITLLGGEPTMRGDLPDLVREIVRMGFKLKLITNGLRFEDPAYAAELKAQGLRWIIYQFDGFDPEIYVRLRGQDLLARKLRILNVLAQSGFQICLAAMIVAGVNDHQLGDLIRFGFASPGVRHISLLPASSLGRDEWGLPAEHLHAEDVMSLIAAQTGDKIEKADWLATMRLMDRLHRWTGHIDFKQRVCFYSMPLVGAPDDFIPAIWLTQARRLAKNLRHARYAPFILKNIFAIDGRPMPPGLLYLSIEKMHCAAGIHLGDAAQCNTLYLTRDGLTPTCVYNALYRKVPPACEFF